MLYVSYKIIFVFISFFSLLFKWQRLIFILISLEFLVMSLFYYFSLSLNEMLFFYFMCFSVISSVLGMVVMVGNMKNYGNDLCIFCSFKLILNYRSSKPKILSVDFLNLLF